MAGDAQAGAERQQEEESRRGRPEPGLAPPPAAPDADHRQRQGDVAEIDLLALVHRKVAAVGPRRRVVGPGTDHSAQNRVQLRRHGVAGQVGGKEIGKAAARREEVTFRGQVGQHVGEDRGDADGEEQGKEEKTRDE